jgi:hypothetical protein
VPHQWLNGLSMIYLNLILDRKNLLSSSEELNRFLRFNCFLAMIDRHGNIPMTFMQPAGFIKSMLAWEEREGELNHIQRVINTPGYDFWIACYECLKVFPINR